MESCLPRDRCHFHVSESECRIMTVFFLAFSIGLSLVPLVSFLFPSGNLQAPTERQVHDVHILQDNFNNFDIFKYQYQLSSFPVCCMFTHICPGAQQQLPADQDPTDLSKVYPSPIYKTSERKVRGLGLGGRIDWRGKQSQRVAS